MTDSEGYFVVALNRRWAEEWRREAGVPIGAMRLVTDARMLCGIRLTEARLVLVPGWHDRADRALIEREARHLGRLYGQERIDGLEWGCEEGCHL